MVKYNRTNKTNIFDRNDIFHKTNGNLKNDNMSSCILKNPKRA